ncbi:MAG: hypothetical protein AB1664_23625 [Thermodesulfobacteriota bacterium]
MRPFPICLCVLVMFSLCCIAATAIAQTDAAGRPSTPDQWASHQMNQPPPDKSGRHQISEKRIDEIKELYQQAKKDLDSKKTDTRPSSPAQP